MKRVEFAGAGPQLFSIKEVEYLRGKAEEGSAGVWTLTSPDGEGGHVGTVLGEIACVAVGSSSASEIGQIIIVYRAKLLDKPSTALNLTHHWGFNLSASAVAKGKPVAATAIGISDHILSLKSKHILDLEPATSLPAGSLIPLSAPSAAKKNFGAPGGKSIGHRGSGYPTALAKGQPANMSQGFTGEGYDDYWVFDREARKDLVVPDQQKETMNVFEDIERE